MKLNKNEYSFKEQVSYFSNENIKKTRSLNLKLVHKIFDTINISLVVLIVILSFLSFNSQKEWSEFYRILSQTKIHNNNLIDYISKTEEFYINKLESSNTFKKTSPEDLFYIDKIEQKKENFFYEKILDIMNGLKNSKYQIGY